MKSRIGIYFWLSVLFYALAIGAYFLPARTSFFDSSQSVVDRCIEAEDRSQVITQRWPSLATYALATNSQEEAIRFGVCPFEDYYVKTYAVELYLLAGIAALGALAHHFKLGVKNGR